MESMMKLQKQYGLPVDKSPYWKSVQNRPKWNGTEGNTFGDPKQQSDFGKKGGRAKRILTIDQVKSIRIERRDKNTTMLALANKYNVSKGVIFYIVHNKSYADPEYLI